MPTNGDPQLKDAIAYSQERVSGSGWRGVLDEDPVARVILAGFGYVVDSVQAEVRRESQRTLRTVLAGTFAGGAGLGAGLISLIQKLL